MNEKTVAAISTATGAAAINIVRLTGPQAIEIAGKLFTSKSLDNLNAAEHGKMYLGNIWLPFGSQGGFISHSDTMLPAGSPGRHISHSDTWLPPCSSKINNGSDRSLAPISLPAGSAGFAVCFFAPKSYTGEHLVELHCHGGYAAADAVLTALINAGAAPAGRGEFTRRAFLNGKLSLADAEAVADTIHAESTAALAAAGRLANGELTRVVKSVVREIENMIADLEAQLDFPDDVGGGVMGTGLRPLHPSPILLDTANNVVTKGVPDHGSGLKPIENCMDKLDALLRSYETGRVIKNGVTVAIIGVPNVGKSSLLNALLKSERCIVSPTPGTTRDIVEGKIEVDGVAVTFLDTAGLRAGGGKIEDMGVERAKNAAANADIVLFVTVAGKQLSKAERQILDELKGKDVIVAANKSDIAAQKTAPNSTKIAGAVPSKIGKYGVIAVSAKTKQGLGTVINAVSARLAKGGVDASAVTVTNKRHFDAVLRAREALEKAVSGYGFMPDECIIEDLREAYYALGEITGDTASEYVINAVFERFCIGK